MRAKSQVGFWYLTICYLVVVVSNGATGSRLAASSVGLCFPADSVRDTQDVFIIYADLRGKTMSCC